jgi:hypothetical protein
VGSAYNRTGSVEQATVIFKQRTTFIPGVSGNMFKNSLSPCLRQGIESCLQNRRLNRKQGNCRTATTAPFTTDNLAGKRVLYPTAESIHPGHHLVIIIEEIFHIQQLSQIRKKTKWQFEL